MGELFAKLLDLFTSGDKKVVIRLLILLMVFLILGPMIINYFYGYVRLEQQVQVLKSLSEIDPSKLQDQRLLDAYENLLNSVSKIEPASTAIFSAQFSVSSFSDIFKGSNIWKFISGASIMAILLTSIIFAKFQGLGSRIAAFFMICLLGFILGIIGSLIPTFQPLAINIIGFPSLQLFIIIYAAVVSSRAAAKRKSDTQKAKT